MHVVTGPQPEESDALRARSASITSTTMFSKLSPSPSRSPRRPPPTQEGPRGRHQVDHRRKGLPAPRRLRQDDAEDAEDRHDELPQSRLAGRLEFLTPLDLEVIWTATSAANNCEICLSFHAGALLGAEKPADEVATMAAGGVPQCTNHDNSRHRRLLDGVDSVDSG